ncbi:MAG: hypothetical protein IKV51_03550, partial [Clostridia bacterium]|nr:hypothetical protein [Clostridia bacterium]
FIVAETSQDIKLFFAVYSVTAQLTRSLPAMIQPFLACLSIIYETPALFCKKRTGAAARCMV